MKKLFKDKKVTIMGLGLHGGGVGVAKFFYKQGAEVLVTDLKTEENSEFPLKSVSKIETAVPNQSARSNTSRFLPSLTDRRKSSAVAVRNFSSPLKVRCRS